MTVQSSSQVTLAVVEALPCSQVSILQQEAALTQRKEASTSIKKFVDVQSITTGELAMPDESVINWRAREEEKIKSIVGMGLGCGVFVIECIAFIFQDDYQRFGVGYYTGVVFFTTGLLAHLATKKTSKSLSKTAMVFALGAIVIALLGIGLCIWEINLRKMTSDNLGEDKARAMHVFKSIVVFSICTVELFMTLCYCCIGFSSVFLDSHRFYLETCAVDKEYRNMNSEVAQPSWI